MAVHNLGTMTNLSSCTAVVPQPWEKPFTKGNSIVREERLNESLPPVSTNIINNQIINKKGNGND